MDEENLIKVVAVVAVMILVPILNITYFKKRVGKQFAHLAEKFGWILDNVKAAATDLKIHGMVEGKSVVVGAHTTGYGKHKQYFTTVTFTCDNLRQATFRIYKEGFFSKLGKTLGGQDIEMGDPDFDKKFIVKGDATHLQSFLSADLRAELSSLVQSKHFDGTIELKDKKLVYTMRGFLMAKKQTTRLENVIPVLIKMAVRVDGGQSSTALSRKPAKAVDHAAIYQAQIS